jgi:diphthamide synthase (EF-2-diphthine--ammonia ligase)
MPQCGQLGAPPHLGRHGMQPFMPRATALLQLRRLSDPCGEYGEYHSFVYDGPIFKTAIACRADERVMRTERFNYCDIVPA